MSRAPYIYRRYSDAFRRKVVSEIERGDLSISQAQLLYDIGGSETIQRWMHKLGKNHLISKRVRIEMADDINKVKKLEAEKRELEAALAQAHLRIRSIESMLELAGKEVGQDLLKKYAARVSGSSRKRPGKKVDPDTV